LNQKLNQKLKRLIRQLGEAIHETVSESEDIAGVVKDIREEGFDVLLMLEATIGLNELDDAGKAADAAEHAAIPVGAFNLHDVNFLRSLRITVDESAGDGVAEATGDVQDVPADATGEIPPSTP
jgi:uncharacterized protein (UPF0335 family)